MSLAGTYKGPDGKLIKVLPLSDEDRRTLVRWIDLGCLIDLDACAGYLADDHRPTLTLTDPQPGANPPLTRLLVGMHDFSAGLDLDSFQVTADFPVDGLAAGANLASRFQMAQPGVWELKLATPIAGLARGRLLVSIKDRQGNLSRIERSFSVGEGNR